MLRELSGQVARFGGVVAEACRKFDLQLRACRECGQPAGYFDTICCHCGAGNPVKLPISPCVMFTAVAAQMAIVLLRAI